jgi:hypothetical protein
MKIYQVLHEADIANSSIDRHDYPVEYNGTKYRALDFDDLDDAFEFISRAVTDEDFIKVLNDMHQVKVLDEYTFGAGDILYHLDIGEFDYQASCEFENSVDYAREQFANGSTDDQYCTGFTIRCIEVDDED